MPWTTEPVIQPCVVGWSFNSLTIFVKWSPVCFAPGAKKPRGWVIFMPRMRTARPLLAGLIVVDPLEAGNIDTVRPG